MEKRSAPIPARKDRTGWIIAGMGVFVLAVFIKTLAPSLVGGDSGELIAAAYNLGVAHPPGYPLFTLLLRLFQFIPIDGIGWRSNLLSACCDTGAALFLLAAVSRWSGNIWAGVFAAGLFAFSPLIWTYAVSMEVFPLNNLFVAAMLFLTIRQWKEPSPKIPPIAALVLGLGLGNHITLAFYGFPWLAWICWRGWKAGHKPPWIKMALLFAVGLLPYLYLPIAAWRYPAVSWGDTGTLSGFFRHVLRRDYGTLQLGAQFEAGGNLQENVWRYISSLPAETLWLGWILALVGLVSYWRKEKWQGPAVLTFGCFAFFIIFFESLVNFPPNNNFYFLVHVRFWQQPNLLVFAWCGLGFASLVAATRLRNWAVIPLSLIAVALQVGIHFRSQDQSGNLVVYKYARAFLESLPRNTLLLSKGDLATNGIRYLQTCENVRTDVRIFDREMLIYPWMTDIIRVNFPEVKVPGPYYSRGSAGGYSLGEMVDANFDVFPVVFSYFEDYEKDDSWAVSYQLFPLGFANRVYRKTESIDLRRATEESLKVFESLDLGPETAFADGSWENAAIKHYGEAEFKLAYHLLQIGIAAGENTNLQAISLGIIVLEDFVKRNPNPPFWVYKNLGIAYQYVGNRAAVAKAWSEYLRRALPNEPDYQNIQQAMKSMGQ